MGKRVLLFILTNLLVVALITTVTRLFGIGNYLTAYGIDYEQLALFCLVWGMGGSFVSLLLSKVMAKWMMGVKIVDQDPRYSQLVSRVHTMARKVGIQKMPEVGVYESPDMNAFATGPTKNNSLVAVSTGLLNRMDDQAVEGVLAHEVAHIANGDMVTMTLLQGVMNAFVMFLSRAIAFAINQAMRDRDERGGGLSGLAHFAVVIVLEIFFGLLASLVVSAFSRWREYRADKGGARLAGKEKMIAALEALQRNYETLQQAPDRGAMAAFQISNRPKWTGLFASHPPLAERISVLKKSTSLN